MVKFQILGSATEEIGDRELEVNAEKPTSIRELLGNPSLNEDRYIVVVNGKASDLDTEVTGDCKVVIMPKISGG